MFQSCRLNCKQRCLIVVAPISNEEVLTPYIELTDDFPISYPALLGEHWNIVLKDSG
jgi:hypothetical protein